MLFGRLVPGARSLVSIPAGLSEMPVLKFAALTAIGSTASATRSKPAPLASGTPAPSTFGATNTHIASTAPARAH